MSRYIKRYAMNVSADDIMNYAMAYFQSQGFKYVNYEDGIPAFHKGDGWVGCPKHVRISFEGNVLIIESWVRYSVVPYVAAGEFDITASGPVAAFPKSQMKKIVFEFERQLLANGMVKGEAAYSAPAQPVAPVAPASSARVCPVCREAVPDEAMFCGNCGARL